MARDHEVVLALPKLYVPFAEAAGVRACAVRPDLDPANREELRRVMDPFRGAEYLIRKLIMPHVGEAYEDLDNLVEDGDVLVSHPLTYAAPVLAEKRKLLWASTVLAPLGFFSRTDPPLMAVHPGAKVFMDTFPALYVRTIPLAHLVTKPWGVAVRTLRRRLGLPKGKDPVHGGQFSPYLNLAMFSPTLAPPQPDWPPNTIATGAVSYDAIHGGMPPALAEFLDAGSPPIVFTLGSAAVASAWAPRFYQESVQAAADVGARSVLLVGQHDGHRPDLNGRSDVFVADWAPHSELFPRASIIVHQGGAGTMHSALASGHPMLVVPFSHDQGDNAVRSIRLGVARMQFPSSYSRKSVAKHLAALDTDVIRSRAHTVGETIRTETGGVRAAEALERLARS